MPDRFHIRKFSDKRVIICFLLLAAGTSTMIFWNGSMMSPNWSYPYFFDAVYNPFDWTLEYSVSDFERFVALDSEGRMAHRFDPTAFAATDIREYESNTVGYSWIIAVAILLFFWLPPIKAVLGLQVVFHLVSSWWVVGKLDSATKRYLFIVLYAANPLVIHVVTMPFYYYWQVIPSLLLLYVVFFKRGAMSDASIGMVAAILLLFFIVRETTLVLSLALLGYLVYRTRSRASVAALLVFPIGALLVKSPGEPWDTAYIGIGAYDNSYVAAAEDSEAYRLYSRETGKMISTVLPDGGYHDSAVRREYYQVLKAEYFRIWREDPLRLVRNAMLNLVQAFSVGYLVDYEGLRWASVLLGAAVLILLFYNRMYFHLFGVLATVAGFIVYFPPIPVYMFGAYLLLAHAALSLAAKVRILRLAKEYP